MVVLKVLCYVKYLLSRIDLNARDRTVSIKEVIGTVAVANSLFHEGSGFVEAVGRLSDTYKGMY